MIRREEILKSLDIAIRRIAIAAGVVVLEEEAGGPGTFEVITSADVRGEGGEIEIGHLAGLKGELTFIFPTMKLLRVRLDARPDRHEIGPFPAQTLEGGR